MANESTPRKRATRIDRNGLERVQVTIWIPVKTEKAAIKKIGKLHRPSGELCQSVKGVLETIVETELHLAK